MTFRSIVPLMAAAFTLSMFTGCTGCEGVDAPEFTDAGLQSDCLVDNDCETGFLCMEGFCTKDPNACVGNADCDDGDVCRDGQCTDRDESGDCNADTDCTAFERCTTTLPGAEAECLPSAECAAAEPGTACDGECWGNCVSRPSCEGDADCTITEQCDDTANVCIPLGDCEADVDCPLTASCIDGVCTDNGDCTVDEDCDGTQSCIDGDCTRNSDCDVDSDCPEDQRCDEEFKICERRDPCTSNEDCAADEICDLDNDGGTCVVIGDCDTVEDCPLDPEIACLEGICTRAECGRDSDCDDGAFCNGAESCNPRVGCEAGPVPTTIDLASCANEECDEVNDVLVITPINARCGDNSPCTDDVCSPTAGCSNPLNAFQPAPGPVGDCEQTVCLDGVVQIVPADDETPSDIGTATDCRVALCRDGVRVLDVNDTETPVQGATDNCVAHVCREGTITEVSADSEVPPQVSAVDCQKETCSNKRVVSVADNAEVLAQVSTTDCLSNVCVNGAPSTQPATETLAQTSDTDCVTNVCVDGAATTQPANETLPQASAVDCQREVCRNGAPTREADNSEVLAQSGPDDCVTNQCVAGVPSTVANNAETPPQSSVVDCQRETCSNKLVVRVADNTEVLTQTATNDCVTNQCVAGAPSTVANNAEVPPQTSAVDCQRESCSNKVVVRVADNTEVLTQTSATDCRTEQCVNGAPSFVADASQTPAPGATGDCKLITCSGPNVATVTNNSDVPANSGCREGTCTNGTPSTVPDDDNCAGAEVCFASGVCEAPTALTCKTDDNVRTRRVLQHFPLEAIATGARTGTTFVWDLAGVPTGGDPQAHVLTNPNSATLADFQATAPSAGAAFDYTLRVTMNEPGFPAQTCNVTLNVTPLPDDLQVTMFMNDNLDVDLHLTGGVGSLVSDMQYNTNHTTAGDDRNCYWENCKVCTATVEGQGCTALTTRRVDFSNPRNTASLADGNDPQLDIDNLRGCFTASNGERSCVPEKITVDSPPPGTYHAWAYLWGPPQTEASAQLTTPRSTTARIEVNCRGDSFPIVSRTLSSDTATGSNVAAPIRSPRRYGGSDAARVQIVIPANLNLPCVVTSTFP